MKAKQKAKDSFSEDGADIEHHDLNDADSDHELSTFKPRGLLDTEDIELESDFEFGPELNESDDNDIDIDQDDQDEDDEKKVFGKRNKRQHRYDTDEDEESSDDDENTYHDIKKFRTNPMDLASQEEMALKLLQGL